MAVLIWFLAEFLAIRNKIYINLNVLYGTRYGSWYLLGPLTFLNFKLIIDTFWKFIKEIQSFKYYGFTIVKVCFSDKNLIKDIIIFPTPLKLLIYKLK